jgi:hypothetical protein
MAAELEGNKLILAGLGERCPKCSLGTMQRANVRSRRESVLFMLGASILRCSSCEIRQAALKNFRLQMNVDDTDNTFVVVFASLVCGLLVCTAIAIWTLRRAHRWPF